MAEEIKKPSSSESDDDDDVVDPSKKTAKTQKASRSLLDRTSEKIKKTSGSLLDKTSKVYKKQYKTKKVLSKFNKKRDKFLKEAYKKQSKKYNKETSWFKKYLMIGIIPITLIFLITIIFLSIFYLLDGTLALHISTFSIMWLMILIHSVEIFKCGKPKYLLFFVPLLSIFIFFVSYQVTFWDLFVNKEDDENKEKKFATQNILYWFILIASILFLFLRVITYDSEKSLWHCNNSLDLTYSLSKNPI